MWSFQKTLATLANTLGEPYSHLTHNVLGSARSQPCALRLQVPTCTHAYCGPCHLYACIAPEWRHECPSKQNAQGPPSLHPKRRKHSK